jgi:type II secretory pathway component HofQ
VRSTDRTQIQKIMDWVKNKITTLKNTITGNKELNYWNKIKENFERAYNQEYQGNNLSERFSIQIDNNGNKYVRVDTDQDIFDGKSISEQTKIAQEYILNNFRKNGLLKDSDNINVSRKTANEYTHPKKG